MSVTFKGAWFGWAQGAEQFTPIANVSISKKVIHEGSFPFPDEAVTFEAYEHKSTSMTLVTEFFKIKANNRKHTFRMIFANLRTTEANTAVSIANSMMQDLLNYKVNKPKGTDCLWLMLRKYKVNLDLADKWKVNNICLVSINLIRLSEQC